MYLFCCPGSPSLKARIPSKRISHDALRCVRELLQVAPGKIPRTLCWTYFDLSPDVDLFYGRNSTPIAVNLICDRHE